MLRYSRYWRRRDGRLRLENCLLKPSMRMRQLEVFRVAKYSIP